MRDLPESKHSRGGLSQQAQDRQLTDVELLGRIRALVDELERRLPDEDAVRRAQIQALGRMHAVANRAMYAVVDEYAPAVVDE